LQTTLDDRGADFSEDGRYRWRLWRRWDDGPGVMFIGLNPSTANADHDDATIRRCRHFAADWGYGGFVMVNLFAFIATDPTELHSGRCGDGPANDDVLLEEAARAALIVACWGAFPMAQERAQAVVELLDGFELHCFGRTASGAPKHPVRLATATRTEPFT
jgi:hypothetical protein